MNAQEIIDIIDSLNLRELRELYVVIGQEIPRRVEQEREKAKIDLAKRAAEMGFSLNEIFGTDPWARQRNITRSSEAKYRSKSGDKTWSGRGRRPQWVKAHLEAGGRLEDLAI